jgi:hypothetical protein
VCMCLTGCTPRKAAAPGRGALSGAPLPRTTAAAASMFQPAAKRGFTIESLVAKDGGTGGGTGSGSAGSHPLAAAASEEPLRPTALNYPHPSAAEAAFVSGFPAAAAAGAGRSLYGGPELVFPEAMNHPALTVHPAHQLGASPLQPPHSFFGTQHRDPLHFYPWVLRNRFFGHRFQGECPRCARLASVRAATMLGRQGGRAGLCCLEVVAEKAGFPSRVKSYGIYLRSAAMVSHPESEVGTHQAFPGMRPVRMPSPGASVEPLLTLPLPALLFPNKASTIPESAGLSALHPSQLEPGPNFALTLATNSQEAFALASRQGKVHLAPWEGTWGGRTAELQS